MAYSIYSKAGTDEAISSALSAVGSGSGLDTEGVQDVVGAMVQQAGGTYDDAGGTITLPGGSSSAITADDTPAAPAEGESASYFVTSAVSWPAGLVWSTDPDGGVAPTITGTALVSLFTVGGTTRAIMGATFPAPAVPDTTAPTVGTMAASSITSSGFTLTVSGASDAGGLHATPYAFTTDGGATWTAYQASAVYTASGLAASTGYLCNWRVRDAALNVSTGTAQTVTTGAVASFAAVYTANAGDMTDRGAGAATATYTLAGVNIGTAAASRVVIVGITSRGGFSKSLASVTIGGVAATVTGWGRFDNNAADVGWAYATVPSGTTADVVVTYGKANDAFNVARCVIGVWVAPGAITVRTSAFGANAATVSGATIGDQVIATAQWSTNTATTWTGVTQEWAAINNTDSYSSAGGSAILVGTGATVSITDATYDGVGVLVIGPA